MGSIFMGIEVHPMILKDIKIENPDLLSPCRRIVSMSRPELQRSEFPLVGLDQGAARRMRMYIIYTYRYVTSIPLKHALGHLTLQS